MLAILQAIKTLPGKVSTRAHHTLLTTALDKDKIATEERVQRALPEVS